MANQRLDSLQPVPFTVASLPHLYNKGQGYWFQKAGENKSSGMPSILKLVLNWAASCEV